MELCHEQCSPDHERMAQTLLDSFSRPETLCVVGEATERQNVNGLHTGMVQQQSMVATRVAVAGTSNNDSKMQQVPRSTLNSIRTVAIWSDA